MHRIIHLETTDSTNERLKAVADTDENGLVIWADEQLAGKGRLGRHWESDKGQGAWFSLLIKDDRLNGAQAANLVFVCALAAARSLTELTSRSDILIKWPNDVVLNGKKLAGILCESSFDGGHLKWSVCGIGINLLATHFPAELPWAASVLSETGIKLSAEQVITTFLSEFDTAYELMLNEGIGAIMDKIAPISATLGRMVSVHGSESEIIGRAVSFAPNGALEIQIDNQTVSVNAGDVSVRGLMGYTD